MVELAYDRICDIEPCGIGGRNYPFPIDFNVFDVYTGIGGGLKYAFPHCSVPEEYCTKNDYLTIQDNLILTGDGGDDRNSQYLAFNTLYTYTVMDILQIEKIYKPVKGHDNWLFGLASNSLVGYRYFIKYFEWSSSRLQLHVFPFTQDNEVADHFRNINDETIGNDNKYYKWGTVEGDSTNVSLIVDQIQLLSESFDESLENFRNLVTGVENGSLNMEDDIVSNYCKQFGVEDAETCNELILNNGDSIKCYFWNEYHTCLSRKEAALFASGGLRNNVRESLSIFNDVAADSEFVSDIENGILSGSEEAMYGFLAVNVDLATKDYIQNVFDFGGQSIQLTKYIKKGIDLPAYSNDRSVISDRSNIFDENIDYYALSVNNFGSDAAAEWIEEYWTRKGDENACLLTLAKTGVSDKNLCLESLRFLLEPVAYYETECEPSGTCDPDSGNSCPEDECDCDSALSKLMGTSFVLMLLYIVI